MRFRNSRLRTKIVALLVSMTALWAFAAWVTMREGVNLLWVATLNRVVEPSNPLLAELQLERRLTTIYLAGPNRQRHDALAAQRSRTDQAKVPVERAARSGSVQRAASPVVERRLDEMLVLLKGLQEGRRSVDTGVLSRGRGAALYTQVIASVFRMYDSAATLDDKGFAKDTRTLIAAKRTSELLAQEDALLAGALTTGKVGAADQLEFTQLVGVRRYTFTQALGELKFADRRAYDELNNNPRLTALRGLEDLLVRRSGPGERHRAGAEQWRSTTEPALAALRQAVKRAGDALIERAKPIAAWVVTRLVLAGGLGLIAVIASIVVSVSTARKLVRQLDKLRASAWELAERRLPGIVERLGHGEQVDVAGEAPPLEFGNDEIGQVGHAFNAVQETAIRTAVQQAELRRGIRDVLLSLARRSQTLVHRQLTLLDTMERRELDTKELEDLFRLDHLATRMRRNAENLIVLSGSTPARGWRRSVPIVDVVRAAVAEVEDYTRVTVLPFGLEGLAGRSVGDITHLLAELIENAVSFSPPYTTVQVGGQLVASGYAVEIEDRGLGMTADRLTEINERISDPPEFNLAGSVQLGLYVVGRLAERYGLQVSLKRSPYGGTTAVVLIPRGLVIDHADQDSDAGSEPDEVRPAAAVPAALTAAQDGDDQPQGRVAVLEGLPENLPDYPPPETPPELPPAPQESHTPGGLPFRVPQASLAPALRTDGPAWPDPPESGEDEPRSPEEIRKIVGAYQTGTRRGRTDAARSLGESDQGDRNQKRDD